MRIAFQKRPCDLLAALSYTMGLAGLLGVSKTGSPISILLSLLVPGYLAVAAMYPSNHEIDWIERLALSVGLDVAIIAALGVVLSATAPGVQFSSVLTSLTLLTVAEAVVAYWRRMRLPPDRRLALEVKVSLSGWAQQRAADKILTIILVSSVIVAVVAFTRAMNTPQPGDRFTEFYFLGLGANVSAYPNRLNLSESGNIVLGISNHEGEDVSYTLHVDLLGERLVHNATSGFNETVEVNRTTWSSFPVTLADGQNWTQPYTFRINETGLWKVQFLLFKDGDVSRAYRELHLYVTVA